MPELAADARVLWRLLRGQPRRGSHAERLQAFYAPQADRYDAFRSRLLHGREELLMQLRLKEGMHVVELGCGTGSSLDRIGDRIDSLGSLHLVDLCPALLEIARRRAENRSNVWVVEADATCWKPAAKVDVVLLSYALTMIPDWPAVLANARAMLRVGGKIGVVDFYLPEQRHLITRKFWSRWFRHDGVHLSSAHLPALRCLFVEYFCVERLARVPYMPGLKAPYYLFVGERPD
jgi:S-adenosylmethionine-diacylgycerolhomoserine-N-methlytransferase